MKSNAALQHTYEPETDYVSSKNSNAKAKEKLFKEALAVINNNVILTRNSAGTSHVTFTENDLLETVPLHSSRLPLKLKRLVRSQIGARLTKPMTEELVEELQELADAPEIDRQEVNHRVSLGSKGQIFIDLCNDRRDVLVVDASGFRLHDFNEEAPLFLRSHGMMALPNPTGVVGDFALLRDYLNVPSDSAWRLLIVYMLFSFRPMGPYVILIVQGTAGSSKSTFSRVVRRLLDPSSVSTQSIPKTTADLMITASNSHLLVFDNVRELSPDMSDAFCRLATGGGMRTRALFTNDSEALFHATKPCLLNGIDGIASQPDLLSRCIQIDLPVITNRRTEEEFNRSLEAALPVIFAGLLDALSRTLAALPHITDVPSTRMADFAFFGVAVERALGWPTGSFAEAYAENQREQMVHTISDDPLAQVMKVLVREEVPSETPYTRTPTSILRSLDGFATDAQLISKAWPHSPHSLSKKLKKLEPALRACGIGIEFAHSGNRTITVTRLDTFKN